MTRDAGCLNIRTGEPARGSMPAFDRSGGSRPRAAAGRWPSPARRPHGSAAGEESMAQPTMRRLNTSTRFAKYGKPASVGTHVMSATYNRSGAAGLELSPDEVRHPLCQHGDTATVLFNNGGSRWQGGRMARPGWRQGSRSELPAPGARSVATRRPGPTHGPAGRFPTPRFWRSHPGVAPCAGTASQ